MTDIVLLKLGGSLITDKSRHETARTATIRRLAQEIAVALAERPALRLLMGHGAGSFGHIQAAEFGTRAGVRTRQEWLDFGAVAEVAARLNRTVLEALRTCGVPAISFQPSASAIAHDGRLTKMAVQPIRRALMGGLVPVVHGDVSVDDVRGGTIISTEDIFHHLARALRPNRILIAGIERGVLDSYPDGDVLADLTPATVECVAPAVRGSHAPDVTGGMESKVRQMLELAEAQPGLEIWIFSGEHPDLVRAMLSGKAVSGTRIHAPGQTSEV